MRSPLALGFVLKFIASDEDERIDLIARVEYGLKHLIIAKSEITDACALEWLHQDHDEHIELDDESRDGGSTLADCMRSRVFECFFAVRYPQRRIWIILLWVHR